MDEDLLESMATQGTDKCNRTPGTGKQARGLSEDWTY